ncbi:hypothetical protein MBLNU457_2157t1 [Dothideomycetes sp. NU457]
MATATVAKPGQALKRSRPSISMQTRTRTGTADESDEPVAKLSEPYVKTPEYILRKFKGQPPSLVVHLHQNFFRFDKQEGSFSYQSEMKLFMQHMQHQTVPHELMGELMTEDVKFYDGHLIVEVHNHRAAESKTQKGTATSLKNSSTVAFSMHNSGDHVTPSPYGPYPRKSHEQSADGAKTSTSPGPQEKDKGPQTEKTPSISANKKAAGKADVYTLVLFPTEQSREADMMLLANAPVLDGQDGRKGSTAKDGTDRTSSVPQTPTSKKSTGTSQKMRLEPKDFYDFQADYLLHTEGPLLLEPAKTPQEAQRALDLLAHPLHSQPPPASRGRKRTQAELAAEDALAAREEHRMLIMDERIKPTNRSGNAASEAQSGSAQLGFSRFKTLETIKQKHEEKEQKRKEEEARAALEKRQHDMAMAQKRKMMEEQARQRQTQDAQAKQMLMRQQAIQQQQQAAQAQAQAQVQAQAHAHPAAAMAQNPQQQQLQQQAAMSHSSPIVRNQTPMHNSSPMMQNANVMQGGFPMQPTMSNQGAGSPQRPGSAMHHPGVAMARQISQQQNQSRHNTPQISGTPQLMPSAPADINRQMSATPQMQHGSPVQGMTGTPNQNMMMQTPQMNQQGMTQQQQQQQQQHQTMMTMMAQQRQRAQMMQAQMQGQNLNPMQMQQMRQMQQQQQQQQAQAQMNPAMYQAQMQRMQLQMQQNQQQQQQLQQRMGGEQMQQNPSQQSQMGQGQGGMPNADPAVVAQQRQLMIQRNKMNQQMRQMAANGQLNQNMQQQLMAQQQRNLAQQQQLAMNAARNLGDRNNPEQYMQNLRVQQAMMARIQQQQAQMAGQMQAANNNNNNNGGGGGGNMMMNNNINMQQQQQMRQQQQQTANADLAQQFAAMQNALQGSQQQRPGTGMG